jgi:hypothetical protein
LHLLDEGRGLERREQDTAEKIEEQKLEAKKGGGASRVH